MDPDQSLEKQDVEGAPVRIWSQTKSGQEQNTRQSSASQTQPIQVDLHGTSYEERLQELQDKKSQNQNLLLLASQYLIRALTETPQTADAEQIQKWRQLLENELNIYTRLCEQLNIRRDHMLAVRYVLCTALDEVASFAPWNAGDAQNLGIWAGVSLLPQFHGERHGGNVVFLLLGRLAHAPDEHRDVLEVIHHVLSLGFMGDYRTKADGHRQIDAIRHRLHAMLESQKTSPGRELSMHWRGVVQGKFQLLRSLPVWVTVLTLSLLLLGQFVWSKYQLLQERQAVLQSIQALKSLQPPPSPPRKSLRLAQLLEREISEGLVRVEEDDNRSAVIFKGEGMFAGGAYTLSPVTQQITSKVAQAIADVSGNVQILGHTDNQPVGSPPERNVQLSLKRAQEVAKVLQEKGVDPVRIQSTGKGDKEPVATNDTPAGRALNRRVEIVVSATEPLLKDKK